MVNRIMKKRLVAITLSAVVAGTVSGCGSIQAKSLAGSEVLGEVRARSPFAAADTTQNNSTQDNNSQNNSTQDNSAQGKSTLDKSTQDSARERLTISDSCE
jgi:hypothetical protein